MSFALLASNQDDVACWYGKIASLGDFAQRRMPPESLPAFDAWLSRAMQDGRELLGERWLEVYLTAPVLRFAWAPGVIDTHWWFGLLMASCDSVGRYFPLVIAQRRARAPEDRIALDHLELWYEHLAHAALLTLNDEGGSVEALEQSLHDAPPWPTPGRLPAVAVAPKRRHRGSTFAWRRRPPCSTGCTGWRCSGSPRICRAAASGGA